TLYSGSPGGYGTVDGPATKAHFYSVAGLGYLSKLSNGTLVMADQSHTIRKWDTVSNKVTTLAGEPFKQGTSDGKGPAAHFTYPKDIAVDDNGNKVFVNDQRNYCIRKIDPMTGDVVTLAGKCGTSGHQDAAAGGDALFDVIDSMILGPQKKFLYV